MRLAVFFYIATRLAMQVWHKAWEELPLAAIQAWIERIPGHIQKVMYLGGGNEHKEGRENPINSQE